MTYEALGTICGIQHAKVLSYLFENYARRVPGSVAIRMKRDGTRSVSFSGHRAVNMHEATQRIEKTLSKLPRAE